MRSSLVLCTCAVIALVAAGAIGDDDDSPGSPKMYRVTIQNLTSGQPLSPPVAATHRGGLRLFRVGDEASFELEAIARDGDEIPMLDLLTGANHVFDVVDVGVPLTPYGSMVGDFTDAAEFLIQGRNGDRISLASMLVCTNDGFVGLNRAKLPNKGSSVYTLRGYDAGAEDNTELSVDIVDACSALGPLVLNGDPNGNENDAVNTIPRGVIMAHDGVLGIGDLGPVHEIPAGAAKVTITRVSDSAREYSTPLSGVGEVPVVQTDAFGEARFKLGNGNGDDDDDDDGDDDGDDDDDEDDDDHGWQGGGNGDEMYRAGDRWTAAHTPPTKRHRNDGEALSYRLSAEDIVDVVQAHIHAGLPSQNGPIVATLYGPADPSGPVEGTFARGTLTPEDLAGGPFEGDWEAFLAAMGRGELYVNVHTVEFPTGEIRGQIGVRKGGGGGVNLNRPPNGDIIEPPGDVTIAPGESVFFDGMATDPDGDPVTVEWDFGDGSSSTDLTPGDHVYSDAGTYVVTFTATDDQGLSDPSPDMRTITVGDENSPPNGEIIEPPGDVTIAPGESVFFDGMATDPDGDPVTVEWDFGDGSSSTDLTPGDHVYSDAGTYVVTFTATDDQGLSDPSPDMRTITVGDENSPPNGEIIEPPGDVTIAPGESVFFDGMATDPDGDPVTVEWDFGDGSGSTDLTPGDHLYAAPGTYVVTFTATDDQGLSDPSPDTRTITVIAANAPPNGTITSPATDVTIAAGESVFFEGMVSDPDGDPVTVEWDFGDGMSSTQLSPGDHTYSDAGVYMVTFTATDDQGLSDPSPDTRTITVEAGPAAATLTMVQDAIFTPSCIGCHGGTNPTAGMNLEAGQAHSNLVNVPATTQPGLRVIPFNANNSVLVIFLDDGHRNLPLSDRQMIRSWIDDGALDN